MDLDKYDYIQLVVFDIHGIPRGRIVASRLMKSIMQLGMGLISGICFHGVRGEVLEHEYFGSNCGNQYLRPIMSTLVNAQRSVRGKQEMGQVICDLWCDAHTKEMTTPRTIAEEQLKRLEDMGLFIRSSTEVEFELKDLKTNLRVDDGDMVADLRRMTFPEMMLEFVEEMQHMQVYIDTIQAEAGRGRYELTLDVLEGIKGPDMVARLRTAASVFFKTKGLKADFFPKAHMDEFLQVGQINISVWSRDDKNLFLDAQEPGRLSQLGGHWIAGLLTHACALTALCCPTVNCYRIMDDFIGPKVAGWGIDDRKALFRVKIELENAYLENRLPSSVSNPYLVLAGMVAAGIDGVKRKLLLDDIPANQKLPRDLESALKALESDQYMVKALGEDFVKLYAYNKRTFEIEPLKQLCLNVPDKDSKLRLEHDFYKNLC